MSVQPDAALTIVVLAYREGEELRACLSSLTPLVRQTAASTLIVLDGNADARTEHIARQMAYRVAVVPFENFSRQRNKGLELSTSRWVFFIDPDERMTPALAAELARAIGSNEYAAYRVPRLNILFGHRVRHTGWSPDYQMRLLQRERCRYDESRAVHEFPVVEGAIGTLRHRLVHYNYRTWRQFIAKQVAYAPLEAQALYAAGHRAKWRSFIGQPLREFERRYVEYKGYRDGLLGLELSTAMALYRLLTYWRLRQIQKQ